MGEVCLKAGEDFISIDGSTGEVFAGQLSAHPAEVNQVLVNKIMKAEESETYQPLRDHHETGPTRCAP